MKGIKNNSEDSDKKKTQQKDKKKDEDRISELIAMNKAVKFIQQNYIVNYNLLNNNNCENAEQRANFYEPWE